MRCNNASATRGDGEAAWAESGDPSESALLVGAADEGIDLPDTLADRDRRRRRLLHFDVRRKRMTTLDVEDDGQVWLHAKGVRRSSCSRSAPRSARAGACGR